MFGCVRIFNEMTTKGQVLSRHVAFGKYEDNMRNGFLCLLTRWNNIHVLNTIKIYDTFNIILSS